MQTAISSFGEYLRKLRIKKGLTQMETAKGLGWKSPQFVSNIERGNAQVPADCFNAYAKVLKVPTNTLVETYIKTYRKGFEAQVYRRKKATR
jgi:transcriptional regulator with XRE-family HTH domain